MKKPILILFFIIVHFTLNIENCVCQWITQDWTYFQIVRDVKFLDENTGFYTGSTSGVWGFYKTTNGGFNWSQIYFYKVFWFQKIDSAALYMGGRDIAANDKLYRSYNKGTTWDSINYGLDGLVSMYFINRDTGWIGLFNGTTTNIYLTTNGGITLQNLSSISSSWVRNFYFLKEKVNGYYVGYCSNADLVQKTTNSGYNWVTLPVLPYNSSNDIKQITFLNKDTGWVSNSSNRIFKTTNGGYNWIQQLFPGGNYVGMGCNRFCVVNKDTIFSDYGILYFSLRKDYLDRGVVFKTTNGGNNWGYQLPDTVIINTYLCPDFINSKTGWFTNTKTTNGGGPIIFTEVKPISVNIPDGYKLNQNYPNPFNSSTVIEFTIPNESEVTLRIYDITGKIVLRIIEGFRLIRGEYRYKIESFDMSGLSSGVYFFNMTARNNYGMVFCETKKMIFSK